MNDNKITRRTIFVATVCVVYLLLSIFYHHIDKYLTGVIFIALTLLMLTTFVAIVVFAIKGLFQVYRNKQNLSFKFCLPTIIALITLTYTIFSPWRLDSESLESKVEMRACYEGTQNQAYILFRQDKTFELNWTGVFGYDEWWTGQWNRKGDTLILKCDKGKVKQLGDTILIANGYLNPIRHSVDTTKYYRPMFYLGYCKHEN